MLAFIKKYDIIVGLWIHCEHSSKARMQAFQAWNEGSVPSARTTDFGYRAQRARLRKSSVHRSIGKGGLSLKADITVQGARRSRRAGADCKSVVFDWGGSTPPAPTKRYTALQKCGFSLDFISFGWFENSVFKKHEILSIFEHPRFQSICSVRKQRIQKTRNFINLRTT